MRKYNPDHSKDKKAITFENGKLYFSTKAERLFFFIITVLMLVYGFLIKLRLLIF